MNNIDLLLVGAARALVEVAMLTLLAQGLLAVLAGASRAKNPVYRVFQIITDPVLKIARRLAPKVIVDKHLPFVAFFILFWLWILLAYVKRTLCGIDGLAC